MTDAVIALIVRAIHPQPDLSQAPPFGDPSRSKWLYARIRPVARARIELRRWLEREKPV